MDITTHLILIKNKDKTDQINTCLYKDGNWYVKYNNSDKRYTYNPSNVNLYKKPINVDPAKHIIYENDQPISGAIAILDFNDYIRLIFKTGFQKVYPKSQIKIEGNCLGSNQSSNCFDYLKTLANHISVKLDGDDSFLGKQYNGLSLVSPRSVLSTYLERKPLKSEKKDLPLIFPFGFNTSQKSAAENAFREQVSIIEGPPGTGKTQTILNIIANAVINQKSVAVVSNNNSATANVQEKLQKYNLEFISAFLGNKENKASFFSNQNGAYPDMRTWVIEESEYQEIKQHLRNSHHKLNEMLTYKNKRAVLKQELAEVQTEYTYFQDYSKNSKLGQLQIKSFRRLGADKTLQLIVEYKQAVENGTINLKKKLGNLIRYGIYNARFYTYSPETVITYLQNSYYELKMQELMQNIQGLENKLESYNFDKAMENYSKNSMKLLKASLAKSYGLNEIRKSFQPNVLWKDFSSFIYEYPVILSTTHSLRNCAANNYLFDYVLIDESSQVDIVTGALALSCAKNAVIVGDVKQLPNVVPEEVREQSSRIFQSYNLDSAYHYAEHSLLSSLVALYENIPKTLLKEHYRCHPKIIGFCNQKFYNNELVVLTEENEKQAPLMLYKTAKGNHARGTVNQRQIDVVFNEIIPSQKLAEKSIGVITPYRLQADEFKKSIRLRNMEADTVHKFQGREKDIIILSTVSNEVKVDDFADDPNLINVAVSRAVDQLVVVVADGSEDWKGTNLGDLVKYIKYNNFDIIESQIYSVFDLLYSSYSEKLLEVLKNSKQVSAFKSENLMNTIIEKILNEESYNNLDYVLHQPLRMLIKDTEKLTDAERKYAMNILTHTDFVIFNRLDKLPVLVVEVDGHAYHANNPKQLERDKMKDSILGKYDIPLLRVKTTGSGEEEVLRGRLKEVI